ncbi:ribonuclease-III-like-domain-containing protein [Coniochaeta sp. 2T2.1]|nr:ribonuclease-III-like-domain-containing protein [Coniochaeta sp. 2T2.1]
MAMNNSRSAFASSTRALRQCRCTPSATLRPFSSTPSPRTTDQATTDVDAQQQSERPRWSYTPERLKGPGFSINVVKDPRRKVWKVNEDPKRLDAMYNRLLGREGEKMLPEEIKWLAVTHKSFDYGRRGFNTKLAYFGRQILALEAAKSILTSKVAEQTNEVDEFDREPFQHPVLSDVDKLSYRQPRDIISIEKLARLGLDVGMGEVMRWKPRMPENLEGSGINVVLNTSLLAIVGAISLQHGGEVAGRVAREKILRRLLV